MSNRMHIDPLSALPCAREVLRDWMAREMSDISEETVCAGWEGGLEFRLWRAVTELPADHCYCGTTIPACRIDRLRQVAEYLGEWIVWDEFTGPKPIAFEKWMTVFLGGES